MEKHYKKSDYHNYIVFRVEENCSMEQNMILHNSMEGILSCTIYKEMENTYIQYEIDGCISLLEYVKKNEIKQKCLFELFQMIISTVRNMKQYLIPGNRLLLDEESIFLEGETERIKFCCVPGYEKDMIKQLKELTEFLLKYVDHKEQDTVLFIYGFYQLLEQPNISMAMVERYIESEIKKNREIVLEEPIHQINSYIEKQSFDHEITDSSVYDVEDIENNIHNTIHPKECRNINSKENSSNIEVKKISLSQEEEREVVQNEKYKANRKQSHRNIQNRENFLQKIHRNLFFHSKNKKQNTLGKSERKKQKIHYSVQCLNGIVVVIFLFFTFEFLFLKQWKNFIIGILLFIVLAYMIWERQRAYRRQVPRKKEEKRNRIIIREKEELNGEETVLLSQIEGNKEKRKIPCLKPNNKQQKTIILYQTPLVIGSLEEAVDIVLQEKGISRIHMAIEKEEEQFYIRDLNSTNGTRWNGELLPAQIPKKLQEGDKIVIGSVEYEFFM